MLGKALLLNLELTYSEDRLASKFLDPPASTSLALGLDFYMGAGHSRSGPHFAQLAPGRWSLALSPRLRHCLNTKQNPGIYRHSSYPGGSGKGIFVSFRRPGLHSRLQPSLGYTVRPISHAPFCSSAWGASPVDKMIDVQAQVPTVGSPAST